MKKKEKEAIETLLKYYPLIKSNIEIAELEDQEEQYPLKGVNYEKTSTGKTNNTYSCVENFIFSQLDNMNLNILKRQKKIIDIALNALIANEYDMISARYWEGRTLEQMADGKFGTYSWHTIKRWLDKILEKLKSGGILRNMVNV